MSVSLINLIRNLVFSIEESKINHRFVSVNLPEMLSTGNNRMSNHRSLLMVMRHRIATIDLVVAAECLLSIDCVPDVVAVDFALNLVVIHSMERIHYVIPETAIENVAAIGSKNFDLKNERKSINLNKYAHNEELLFGMDRARKIKEKKT